MPVQHQAAFPGQQGDIVVGRARAGRAAYRMGQWHRLRFELHDQRSYTRSGSAQYESPRGRGRRPTYHYLDTGKHEGDGHHSPALFTTTDTLIMLNLPIKILIVDDHPVFRY